MTRRSPPETDVTIAHPLFPLDDEADEGAVPVAVNLIHIRRLEAGEWKTVPAAFPADALQSWEQVWSTFGGGKYELVARDATGRITARVSETLPGPSLPLTPPRPEDPSSTPSPVVMPATPTTNGSESAMLGILLQMMSQQQQQQQQMFLAFLERSDRAAAAQSTLQASMFGQSSQMMANIFQTMAAQKEASRPEEVFIRGIETANALRSGADGAQGGGGGGGGSLADIASTIQTVAQGMQAAQNAPTTAQAIGDVAGAAAKVIGGTES
jgi:hypothetical protein